jgi:hypothetical protein
MSAVLRVATARLDPVKDVLARMTGEDVASSKEAPAASRPSTKLTAGRLTCGAR